MFSGRFGRSRRMSWGEQGEGRRVCLRQLDDDRDEVQRAAQDQRRSQLFVRRSASRHRHRRPPDVGAPASDPGLPGRPPRYRHPADRRFGGLAAVAGSAAIGEELQAVTGGAMPRFSSWSRARFAASAGAQPDVGRACQLRRRGSVGNARVMRSMLCSLAVYHSPSDQLMVVTRHPEVVVVGVAAVINHHDEMFDACGLRRLVSPRRPNFPRKRSTPNCTEGPRPVVATDGLEPHHHAVTIEAAAGSALGPALGSSRQRRHRSSGKASPVRRAWPGSPSCGWPTTRVGVGSAARTSDSSCGRAPSAPGGVLRGGRHAGRQHCGPLCAGHRAVVADDGLDVGDREVRW